MRLRLTISLALVTFVAALEFWGGLRAQSLALITDAAHVCMDVFAIGIALAALVGAQRPANSRKTFGYGRLEILGALLNGTLLLTATIFIVYEAVHRFFAPVRPQASLMMAVAGVGLLVNGAVGFLLLRSGRENLNVRAALFHVAGDALAAFMLIVGGGLLLATGAVWIDPALSLFVAAIIVSGVLRILRDATDVLLESAPRGMNLHDLRGAMAQVRGVVAVHDLHVWTIGSGERALSAHILLDDRRISEATAVLNAIDTLVRDRFSVTHATLQFECESCEADERVVCTQRRDELSAGSKRPGL